MRVPFEGGSPEPLVSGYLFMRPLLTPPNLILAAGAVPSNNGDVILSVPLAGGSVTTIATLDDAIVNGFATDGTYIYFSDSRGVNAIPMAPDSSRPNIISLVPGLPDIIGAFGGELLIAYAQGAVESVPLPPRANSPVTSRGSCPPGPTDLMRCGANACWLAGTNTLEELGPSDSAPRAITLTGRASDAFDVAFDSTDAYVIGTDVESAGDFLERVPLDGSPPVLLASTPSSSSRAVAVDDACVYWSSSQGILSLAKTSDGFFAQ